MLKKTIIIFILIIFLLAPFSFSLKNINFTEAATTISYTTISEDTTWIWEDSPYIISRNIIIREGATLTIEPGVIVKFEQNGITARGELNAIGEEGDPIIFTSIHDDARGGQSASWSSGNPAPGDWGGIKTQTNGSVNLNYAVINYGGQEAIYQTNNKNIIRVNTAYAQSYYSIGAVSSSGNSVEIRNSEIAYNDIGIMAELESSVLITDSKIYDNTEAGIINYNEITPINAANNWWGYNSGPYHETLNPGGQGNSVSDNVIFDPWIGQGEEQDIDPVITYSQETNYQTDGVDPSKGTAESTKLTFKAVYTDENNDAPESMNIVISDGVTTITSPLILDTDAASELQDNDFTNGEQYAITFTFPKGKYSYYFEASDGGNIVRLPQTGALAFETGYSNVAFLPGLQASRLYKDGVKLWEPTLKTNNEDIKPLFLDSDGASVNADIVTRDIIDEASGVNIYKGFKEFMDDELVGTGIINEWEALPYDWRLSFNQILSSGKKTGDSISYLQATSSPFIIQEIRRLAENSQNGKVAIVAHSNGGLLAKALLQSLEDSNDSLLEKIDRLILVAVPQIGTPKAVEGLLHGNETQIAKGLLLNEEYAREFAENMQSAYTLLPSVEYFEKIASPIISFAANISRISELQSRAGSTITAANDLYSFLLGDGIRTEPAADDEESPNVLKSNLLANSIDIHNSILDPWTPPAGLKVVQIAGWGADTLSGIEYSCGLLTCHSLSTLDQEVKFVSEGDGTVVFPSAVFLDEDEYFVDLKDFNSIWNINRDHKNILEIESLQTLVKELVQNTIDDDILPEFISTTKPTEDTSRKRLILRSPVAINIFDSAGMHTGPLDNPDSDLRRVEESIPNSYYSEIAGHKYLGLDGRDTYRIELQGEDLGTFTLEINDVLNDEIIGSNAFIDIPVTENTMGELTITQSDTTALALDIDGDGAADITVNPGEEVDSSVSLEILAKVIETLDIHKGLKKELIKKIEKTIKELEKDKTKKAIKTLEKIIDKLEKEIKHNLKHEEKHHRKNNNNKIKISTEDAQKLIEIIRKIIYGVV